MKGAPGLVCSKLRLSHCCNFTVVTDIALLSSTGGGSEADMSPLIISGGDIPPEVSEVLRREEKQVRKINEFQENKKQQNCPYAGSTNASNQ